MATKSIYHFCTEILYNFLGVNGEKGEKGDRGLVGPQGRQGTKGEPGERGTSIGKWNPLQHMPYEFVDNNIALIT